MNYSRRCWNRPAAILVAMEKTMDLLDPEIDDLCEAAQYPWFGCLCAAAYRMGYSLTQGLAMFRASQAEVAAATAAGHLARPTETSGVRAHGYRGGWRTPKKARTRADDIADDDRKFGLMP